MSQPSSVFFTGMESSDAEQLTGLFQEINRRSGNRWTLASDADSAGVLVIDVDTLYGHMTWLRAQASGQIVVALTAGERADADHVLHRPVTPEAMRRLMHGLSGAPVRAAASEAAHAADIAAAPPAPVPTSAKTAAPKPAPAAAAAPTPPPARAAEPAPAPASAPAPVPAPVPIKPAQRRLIDVILAGELGDGPHKLELPGQPPLVFDLGQKMFLCGSGIKAYLPHTQAVLALGAIKPVANAEMATLRREIGEAQPLGRLLWLAALGGAGGEIPGAAAGARYRLGKWPQIEREFPKHFRLATAMMKGFQTPAELAEQSGVSVAEVNDFIAASLVSGHAEAEGAAGAEAAPGQKGLLERLRAR